MDMELDDDIPSTITIDEAIDEEVLQQLEKDILRQSSVLVNGTSTDDERANARKVLKTKQVDIKLVQQSLALCKKTTPATNAATSGDV
jgi:hypothetical protein